MRQFRVALARALQFPPLMTTHDAIRTRGPAPSRFITLLRRGFFAGAVLAVAFVAGGSPAANHQPIHPDTLRTLETPPEQFTFQSGRSWRMTAERLEHRRQYNRLLEHLERVIERETGSGQAEARLWRGAFIYRRGLYERAGEVFDSLLTESSRYSMLLSAPIAENAWRAALTNDRPAAAERALEAWRAARERLAVVGLNADNEQQLIADEDSTYAEALFEIGRQYLKWNRDRGAGRAALERALSVGLSGDTDIEARLVLAQLADADGAPDAAADQLGQILDGSTHGIAPTLVARLRQARADAEYNAGRFDEARRHYDEILPRVTSAADSEWVIVQLGDAAHQLGEPDAAISSYDDYLRAFPHGSWTDWVRFRRGDIDTTGEGS